jgi:hypothetical protein
MSQKKPTLPSKKILGLVAFRHSESVDKFIQSRSRLQNLDRSSFNRVVYNAGLSALYNLTIVGNEIVDSAESVTHYDAKPAS